MEKDRIIINQLIIQWESSVEKSLSLFDSLSSWALDKEVAPNRNTVQYLMGHLVAVHDRIIEALELGDRFHPELDKLFIEAHDKNAAYPDYAALREAWLKVNNYLSVKFRELTSDDWLSKHHYVSPEDFLREPHRNKLAILLSRYTHLYNHVGQLRLIKKEG